MLNDVEKNNNKVVNFNIGLYFNYKRNLMSILFNMKKN